MKSVWGAVVLWAYSSANGAKGWEIESPWKQKKTKQKSKWSLLINLTRKQVICIPLQLKMISFTIATSQTKKVRKKAEKGSTSV